MVGWFNKDWFSTATRLRYCFLAACAVAGFYLIVSYNSGYDSLVSYRMVLSSHKPPTVPQEDDQERSNSTDKRENRFTIHTEGCIIPKITPYDPLIKQFVEYPSEITKCPKHDKPFMSANQTHIWLNKPNYRYYGVAGNERHVRCCYRSFSRPDSIEDVYSRYIDDRITYESCDDFNDTIEIYDEFVRVDCYYNKTTVLDVQYFASAIKKPSKVESSEQKYTDIYANKSYSILILGIDAVSRMNFHRTMPKTLNYLKSKGAVELLGYNKVGDNTFPNLVAMLLGFSESDLKNTCWPSSEKTFDNCPFVWDTFKRKGYLTAFGEDYGSLGTFNYQKIGFMQKPTDYYLHPFTNEAEKVASMKRLNSYLCLGYRYFFNVLLDYVKSLVYAVQPTKLFAVFWEATMSHDYLNFPVLMDFSYVKLLQEIDKLNNTIVFLVSDHGIRWGGIRETRQGRLEERLPFVYIWTPRSFEETYKEAFKNLRINTQQLTTPFDIHATLKDLADMHSIEDSAILNRGKQSYANQRGVSLFLPIPGNRTCKSADIAEHWCTCHFEQKLNVKLKIIQEAANFVVSHINQLVHFKPECSKLTLSKVIDALEMTAGATTELLWREFLIVVQTSPGDGIFEATVHNRKNYNGLLEHSIPSDVSRLNLYANQSHCVHGSHLKLYCYCK